MHITKPQPFTHSLLAQIYSLELHFSYESASVIFASLYFGFSFSLLIPNTLLVSMAPVLLFDNSLYICLLAGSTSNCGQHLHNRSFEVLTGFQLYFSKPTSTFGKVIAMASSIEPR